MTKREEVMPEAFAGLVGGFRPRSADTITSYFGGHFVAESGDD